MEVAWVREWGEGVGEWGLSVELGTEHSRQRRVELRVWICAMLVFVYVEHIQRTDIERDTVESNGLESRRITKRRRFGGWTGMFHGERYW
jgi:hypothetical protein